MYVGHTFLWCVGKSIHMRHMDPLRARLLGGSSAALKVFPCLIDAVREAIYIPDGEVVILEEDEFLQPLQQVSGRVIINLLCPMTGYISNRLPAVRQKAANAAGVSLQVDLSMASPTMKAVVDAVWAMWSIGASIYDYIHTSAMEERIIALENIITIHQCVIGLLSAGVLVLFTYILFRKL